MSTGPQTINTAILSLGSNIPGSASDFLRQAMFRLQEVCQIVRQSSIYATLPYNKPDTSVVYNNIVLEVSTDRSLDSFLATCKGIEQEMGRCRDKGEVLIDIDIVYWNDSLLRPSEIEREYFLIGYRQLRHS